MLLFGMPNDKASTTRIGLRLGASETLLTHEAPAAVMLGSSRARSRAVRAVLELEEEGLAAGRWAR